MAEALQRRSEAGQQGGERFRRLAAMTSDWFWELDADFRFVEIDGGVQPGAQARLIAGELLGTRPWDHAWLRPVGTGWQAHRAQLEAHQAFSAFLVERVTESGPSRVMALRGEPVYGADGAFSGYHGTGADITRRYRAEQALRESEARNRALIDSAPEAIFVVDADAMKVLDANPSAVRLFGMSREELLTAPIHRFNAPQQPGGQEYGLALMRQALAGDEVAVEWLFYTANGREFPAELRLTRLPGAAGLLRLSVVDISERRVLEAERERLQAESRSLLKRLHQIIETMPLPCVVHDAGYIISTWNPAAERVFGYAAAEALGRSLLDLVVPAERHEEISGRLHLRLSGVEPPAGRRVVNLRRDGSRIQCEWYGALIRAEEAGPPAIVIMAMDVTDRVEAEEALRQSEERFRRLTALSSDWYWELDAEYRFAAVTGREGREQPSADAELGRRRWERPELRPVGFTWEEHRRDLDQRKSFSDLVIAYAGADGERAYWSISGEPVFNSAGGFTGYRGVGADITQRYRIYALRAGEKELFEQLAAGAPLEQLMTLLCHAVEAALARRGVAAVNIVKGSELHHLAGPSLPEGFRQASWLLPLADDLGCCPVAVLQDRVTVSADIETDPHWARFRADAAAAGFRACWSVPVHGAGGRVIATLAVYHDLAGEPAAADLELSVSAAGLAGVVIERSEAESALRENEARYRTLVEGAQAGVFVYRDDVIEYVNPAMVALMRAPDASALLGLRVDSLLASEFLFLARGRRLAMGAGLPGAGFAEMQLVRLDQTRMDAEVGSSVVSRDRGLVIQAQVHDISARKWTEREIMRLNESLEARVAERTAELSAANREMESFSYTVAHDLRAPLRSIDGFSRMLRVDAGDRLDERMRRDLDIISANARRMAELIDGLLEFARFSRGEPARQRVATAAMVEAVILETPVPAGGMRPEFAVGALPDMLGDAAMLRQVWVNLISNAVKFTSRRRGGKVEIEARSEPGGMCYTVRDNGAGFDPAYANKLFGMFQRLHRQDEFEGTGVGLAIVKRVIERHGGRVWAEGQPGEGASFHFSLPPSALAD
ncbi:MAG TPA: PAS domain S-box protein [Burkholderiales bacterium]|nr:PAS domain S-box protein [Burkholderiales bacterium]